MMPNFDTCATIPFQALVAFATTAKDAKGMARATDKVLDDKRRKLLADMVAAAGGSGSGSANGTGSRTTAPAASAAPLTAGAGCVHRWYHAVNTSTAACGHAF